MMIYWVWDSHVKIHNSIILIVFWCQICKLYYFHFITSNIVILLKILESKFSFLLCDFWNFYEELLTITFVSYRLRNWNHLLDNFFCFFLCIFLWFFLTFLVTCSLVLLVFLTLLYLFWCLRAWYLGIIWAGTTNLRFLYYLMSTIWHF